MDAENADKFCWKKVVFRDLPAVDGHCSSVVDGKIFIFGGVVHSKHNSDYYETNKMAVARPMYQEFKVLDVSGDVPKCRSSATMAAVGKKLYMFGGLNSEHGWLDDFNMFDTETSSWIKLQTFGSKPSPRDKVASAVVGDKIYFFGGFGPLNVVQKALHRADSSDDDDEDGSDDDDDQSAKFGWFNDLFLFDTTTKSWSQIHHFNINSPSPRAASSICSFGNSLLVFGGRDKDGRCNDLYLFDTVNPKWTKVVTSEGSIPEARSFHSAVVVGNFMVVVGGLSQNNEHLSSIHVFDFDASHWVEFKVEGLTGRGCHTLDILEGDLVVFGGSGDFNRQTSQCCTYFNEFCVINTNQLLRQLQSNTEALSSGKS